MKMKSILLSATIVFVLAGCMKQNTNDTPGSLVTKEILLQQLKNTHTSKDWFVPVNPALEGLTSEQAMWRDSSGNHSIGQLAYHIAFWNERQLAKFNEQPEGDFSGNNEETFTSFNQADWDKTVNKVDSVMDAFEKGISAADEKKLKDWYPVLANISVHNAYHTGQIVYIRKMKGWWDPEKGVK